MPATFNGFAIPDLKGKAVLITGGSTGIGAVYADRLANRGYDLILVARDQARMEALADRLRDETGRTIEVVRADLTDSADLARVAGRFTSTVASATTRQPRLSAEAMYGADH